MQRDARGLASPPAVLAVIGAWAPLWLGRR